MVAEGLKMSQAEKDDYTNKETNLSRQQSDDALNAEPPSEGKKHVDEPPNGGYGWVCAACCALINGHTWGVNSTYGVFLSYYLANNVYPGATAREYAFVGGLSIACALVVSPLATVLIKRWGTRNTCFLGIFFETLSLVGASFSRTIWQLFLSQGVCFGFGMGFLLVASVGVVPQWFTTKRSFANGLAAGGSGIGGLTYSLAAGAMIESIGLDWAFRVLGIVACSVNFVCALLLRDRNKEIGVRQVAFDHRLFRRAEFNLFLLWGFFSMLGYVALLFSLPNYALTVGLTAKQGSIIGAVLNLGQALGRPFVGFFSDRYGRINVCSLLTLICGIFCFVIWIFAKSFGVLVFFSLIVGTVAGTIWVAITPVGTEVVGLVDLPSALSISWLALAFPAAFAETIALELRQKTGNIYFYAQIYTGLMYIVASFLMWGVRCWKVGQLEGVAAEMGGPIEDIDKKNVAELYKTISKESQSKKSSLLRRTFVLRKV